MKQNIYSLLKGKFLISDDAFKNWRMILFISALAIVMIACSHSADKKVHEIAKLNNQVKELRSIMIEGRGKLMKLKNESYLEEAMQAKGLVVANIPPQKIKVISKKK